MGILTNDYGLFQSCKAKLYYCYCNDTKFWDKQVRANSVYSDQTAPRGTDLSGSSLFAIQSASFGEF